MRHFEKFGDYWIRFHQIRSVVIYQEANTEPDPIFAVVLKKDVKRHQGGILGKTLGKVQTRSIKEAKSIGNEWIEAALLPTGHSYWITADEWDRGKDHLVWRSQRGYGK